MKNVLLTTLLTLFAATALAQSGSVSATLVDADTGESYGTLTDVLQTGANDVYEIKDAVGKALYIPAIPDVVLKTDLQDGRMQIRPLEGLLDAN